MVGDNSFRPALEFIENPDALRAGDQVVSSGDGGVFPPGLLIGRVVQERSGRLRVQPAADLHKLEFLRVIRHFPRESIEAAGDLIVPRTVAPVVTP